LRPITRSQLEIIKKREGEPWIYSYADLVTNLLAFFMMLLIIMSSSKAVREEFTEGLKDYVEKKGFAAKAVADGVSELSVPQLRQVIDTYLKEKQLTSEVSLTETRTGIELTFEAALVFDSATAEIREEAGVVLEKIATLIAKLPSRFVLDVEGHADNRPITSSSIYPSNWELSSARAGSVVRFLEANGLQSRRLRAIGYGTTQQLDKKPDASINRRVVIKVNSKND
jgi:chemotaxis protein MotB